MSLSISFADTTITRLRPTTRLDHGAQVSDWSDPESEPIGGCVVEPMSSLEISENRDLTLGARRILAPEGADVAATDRLEIPGERGQFEVVGEPLPRSSPTGALAHLEILANRWTEGRRS